jgi:hypothetical protein
MNRTELIAHLNELDAKRTRGKWAVQEKFGGGYYGAIYAFHAALDAGEAVIDDGWPLQEEDANFIEAAANQMMQLINEQHDLMKGIYRITSQIAGDSTQESMWIALAEITAALEHAGVTTNGKEGE